jgi:uncharacterized protein (TIGR02246 family)
MNVQYKNLFVATAILVTGGAAGWANAQQPSATRTQRVTNTQEAPAADRPADENAIRAASQAFAKAFETGNAQSVAALFTDGAEYIDEEGGEPIHGRDALAKAYADFFANRPELQVESKTDAIRFLGPDTAIEEGTFTVTAKDSPPNASRFSALHVRQGDKWLIAMLKEWGDESTSQPSLEDLAWLVGTWEADGAEMTARTTYEWTPTKAFIRADYTITPKKDGEQPSSGVQVIGVDPAVGYIRAWLFDADGGIGESTWVWDGDRWLIESVGTLSDGSHTRAVNFVKRSGDDAFTWQSVERTLEDEPQPDIPPVTVKRVAQAAGAPSNQSR